MSTALEKLTFSILLLDNLSKPAKGICRSLRRIQKISSAGFSNIKLGVANMAGGAAALSGFVSPVLFEPDQSAGRSHEKSGNKANEHNPKCNFCTQNDAFFANIHTAIFTFFDAIFHKSGNETQRNAKQEKPTANKTCGHVQYGTAPLHEGRGQHSVITILQHHIKTAVSHSFYLRFDTITQKGEMSNVFCS